MADGFIGRRIRGKCDDNRVEGSVEGDRLRGGGPQDLDV